jgi:hypothetical protein
MKKQILTLFLILITTALSAQGNDIILHYDKGTKEVYKGDTLMSMENLYRVMRPYPEAFKYIESSWESGVFAKVFYWLGALPVGFTVGYFLPTREFLWKPFVVGVGLIGIGIPLYVRSLKEKQRAVKSFNGRHDDASSFRNNMDLTLGFSQNGIGLLVRF